MNSDYKKVLKWWYMMETILGPVLYSQFVGLHMIRHSIVTVYLYNWQFYYFIIHSLLRHVVQ